MNREQIKALAFPTPFDSEVIEGEQITLEAGSWRIVATIHDDDDASPPWEREEGHGDVTGWTSRDKKPGEMILNEDHGSKRFYDFAGTVRIARLDGWNAEPFDVPGETAGQRAAKAALADFNRLKAWCDDEWCYVGVDVRVSFKGVELVGEYDAALWGIESDSGELTEVANELIGDAMAQALAKLEEMRSDDAKPFKVEGVEDDGSRTTLQECDTSSEARSWLAGYVKDGDAGNWDLIEVYDTRGDDAERVAVWERPDE